MKAKTSGKAKQSPAERAAAVGRIGAMLDGAERLADALEAGGPLPPGTVVREFHIPAPTSYTPEAVVAVRDRLGLPQPAFARLLGVSTELARSWEQGRRVPGRLASRMLDTVAADPAGWLRTIGATVPAQSSAGSAAETTAGRATLAGGRERYVDVTSGASGIGPKHLDAPTTARRK